MMRFFIATLAVMFVFGCASTSNNTVVTSKINEAEVAKKAYDGGDYAKAVDFYERWLAKYPEDSNMYFERGRAYNKMRKYQKALADFDKAAKLNSKDGRPLVYRCGILSHLGNFGKAQKLVNFLKTGPHFAGLGAYEQYLIYCLDARLKNANQDFENALTSANEAEKIYNLNPDAFATASSMKRLLYYRRAVSYYHLGNYPAAANDMEQYIQITKQAGIDVSPKAYKSLAQAYYLSEELQKCKLILVHVTPEDRKQLGEGLNDVDFFVSP